MGSYTYDKILENFTDYRSVTTFWDDYSIADRLGAGAVKELYKSSFADAKKDYKHLTELVMVLNHRMWMWHDEDPESLMYQTYAKCFEKAHSYAMKYLNDSELRYYLRVTD